MYDERLDDAMDRYDAEVDARLRQYFADEGISPASDYATYTPEYIYKMRNGEVSF